jgi:hypothetical protein
MGHLTFPFAHIAASNSRWDAYWSDRDDRDRGGRPRRPLNPRISGSARSSPVRAAARVRVGRPAAVSPSSAARRPDAFPGTAFARRETWQAVPDVLSVGKRLVP